MFVVKVISTEAPETAYADANDSLPRSIGPASRSQANSLRL